MASAGVSASASASAECGVCCEKINQSTHSRITCEYGDCNYSDACKACVRHYLLNTAQDPHCMNCKKVWSQKFLVEQLNKSYISKDYKDHKKQFLLEREISKLPESMEAAEKYKHISYEEEKMKAYTTAINKLRHEIYLLSQEQNQCSVNIFNIKRGHGKEVTERKVFIMPCPNNDCRGYLSSQYKCQLCNLQTCSKCHEIMGHSKQDEHVCIEENIQTAELIKKETKGCPCCGTRIFKISGCDQMWCITCHKAFSWKTGRIETGVIHNPHFYEYQRKINGGVAPRNLGDVPCNDLATYNRIHTCISSRINNYNSSKYTAEECKKLRVTIMELHRFIAHINRDLQTVQRKITEASDNEQIRVDYIIKKISKEEMATKIYRNNSIRQKHTELAHIYELIHTVGVEFFRILIDSKKLDIEFVDFIVTKLNEFHKLREYCNEQFAIISNTYSQMVPQIDETFTITSKKLSTKKTKSAVAAGKAPAKKGKAVQDQDQDDQDETPNENIIIE